MNRREIEELFGAELVDGVTTLIREETAGLAGQVESNALQVRRNRVMAMLDADPVIGAIWRAVNNEPGFLAWLAETDPLWNTPRMQPLRQAFDRGDVERVRAIFAKYLAEQGRIPAATPPTTSSQPSGNRAPGGQRQRQWTRGEIARFYEDCRLGKYNKQPDERAQLERDIIAAAHEGRIIDPPLNPDIIVNTMPSPPRFRFRAATA